MRSKSKRSLLPLTSRSSFAKRFLLLGFLRRLGLTILGISMRVFFRKRLLSLICTSSHFSPLCLLLFLPSSLLSLQIDFPLFFHLFHSNLLKSLYIPLFPHFFLGMMVLLPLRPPPLLKGLLITPMPKTLPFFPRSSSPSSLSL